MPNAQARLSERLFAALQLCLPTRMLSTAVHRLAQSRRIWLKQALIRAFCYLYRIDTREAAQPDPQLYPSFNAFFTRPLKPDARPLAGDADTIVSPVDGRLGAFGRIEAGQLFQAKGMTYDLASLLGQHEDWAQQFDGGHFATLYLAPHNYHRVHVPLAATIVQSGYVPGRLFGVNPASVRALPRLFTRNERLISLFDTPAGPMALIMIGAFCVGGIETRWLGRVCPPHRRGPLQLLAAPDDASACTFARGAEMGRFNLGSSVIALFAREAMQWDDQLVSGQPLVLGQALGRVRR